MPDEIIVKFRTPVSEPGREIERPEARKNIRSLQDLQTQRDGYRIREIRPVVKDFDRQQAKARSIENLDRSHQTQVQKRLLRRQERRTVAGEAPDLGRIYRVRVDLDAGWSLDEVLAEYRSRPDVEYAEANPVVSICATPSDLLYADQWALSKIHAPQAWDTCKGGPDVVVAVIDTGVDYNHRDLQGNLWVNEAEQKGLPGVDDDGNGYIDDVHGYNFAYNTSDPIDDHGHGTHCAGIIAAVGNNGLDIAGVCWSARVMPVKILGAAGDGTAADAVPAIYYAVANGADIISGSWGGLQGSEALREAIVYAYHEGVIVVAAAGNDGSSSPYYPAAYPEVVSVAATDSTDRRWYLSNYGNWVDIAAPGRDIVSLRAAIPGQAARTDASRMSGTSMAAPHVSGACALLLAANPLLTCDELPQILTATADPIQQGICSSNGRLNLYEALRAAIPLGGTVRLHRARYGRDADIGVLLADWHLRGTARHTVSMETAGGDEEAVTLNETGVSLGVFTGTIASRSMAVRQGDGILQVRDGESITARYRDGDDGLGGVGQWRQAMAVADYMPPAVVSLEIKPRGPVTDVEFTTSEPTRAEIRYSRTCGGPDDLVAKGAGSGEHHTIELRGLSPQTRYCFVVQLVDEAGNEALADNNGQSYSFVAQRAFGGFRVPSVYPTVQAAIDDAWHGDTIWVADGAYSGDGNLEIDFRGKAITVQSENGPDACVIDCNGAGRAFHFHSGETATSVLDGFTITNGGNADYGTGIRCLGSSPTIRNCVFLKNSAGQYGGGLCNCYGSSPAVVNCTFEENSCSSSMAGRGGGMANRHGSSPTVSDCTFIGNSASYSGGALGNFNASHPQVTRCTFTANRTSYSGGAIGNWDESRPVFKKCTFSVNRADDDGGAVSNLTGSTAVFENCIFSGNIADSFGGAMKNNAATVVLTNCTISGNRAVWSCGGVWSGARSTVRITNCILWGNTDSFSKERFELAQIVADNSDVRIQYCDVQGWSGTLGGVGNFGLDPLFVDPNGGDFHLMSEGRRWDSHRGAWTSDGMTSPCIDAGSPGWILRDEPMTVPEDPNNLVAVNRRIDMGAYGGTAEASMASPGWVLLADVNNDGRVDWSDFAHLTESWTQAGAGREADLTRDGIVNAADLALLALEWNHWTKWCADPIPSRR